MSAKTRYIQAGIKIKIGSLVTKPSRKKFVTGSRIAKVTDFTVLRFPDKERVLFAVTLEGCVHPIQINRLCSLPDELDLAREKEVLDLIAGIGGM